MVFVKGLTWLCCKVDVVLLHGGKVKSTPSPRPKTGV